MKTKHKNVKGSSITTLLRKTFERHKMITVKNSKEFLTFLGTLSWRVVILATQGTLRRSQARVKMIHNFGRYLVNQNRKHGPDWVIAYLKASQLALSKFLAQEPLSSLMEVNKDFIFPRLASGLPKIIGPLDRVSLRHNNRKTIILWMSIFGIFRVLAGTYKLKVSTISDPFSGNNAFLAEKSLLMPQLTVDQLRALPWYAKHRKDGISALTSTRLLLLQSSSSSSKVAWKGVLVDVWSLIKAEMDIPILRWLEITESRLKFHFLNIKDQILPRLPKTVRIRSPKVAYLLDKNQARGLNNPFIGTWDVKDREQIKKNFEVLFITTPSTPNELARAEYDADTFGPHVFKSETAVGQIGQVQFAKEAAGKLRTFAMTDVWTQSIMNPVHKLLTSILREIPNDGTLNQTRSYERAREKALKYGCSYGYDLSAATDRLPISLQVSILRGVFRAIGLDRSIAVELSLLWKEILVNRPFLIPKLPKGVEDPQELELTHIYYEVGQPMGALSSFNMLALTHHMIMQDIATSLGMRGWCELYEITGDDISIFDPQLSSRYLEYMSSLGLEINLKKSVVSVKKAAGEYLKKTWIKNIDVSMISWKQLYQNHSSLMGRCSDALYFLQKWSTHDIPLVKLVRTASLSWKDLSSPDRKVAHIPILTLLSVALRATKVPLDIFLVFLFDENKPNMSFRKLFGKVKDLHVDMRLAVKLLTDFQEYKRIKPVETRSFLTKYQALAAGPLHGIRKTFVDKILAIQSSLIVRRKLPLTVSDETFPGNITGPDWKHTWSLYYMRDAKSFYQYMFWCERNYKPLFGREFPIAEAMSMYEYLPYGSRLMMNHLVDDLIHRPTWEMHCEKMEKIIPTFELYVTKRDLDNLTGNQLMLVLDYYVNLESFLEIHKMEDMDRKLAHKVSLSLLKSFRMSKAVSPWEEYITMWGRPGEAYGMFPDISQWMVKW